MRLNGTGVGMTKMAWRRLIMGLGAVALLSVVGGLSALAEIPQTTENARAVVRANIIRPLGLANASLMNFGTIMPTEGGGSMSLFPSGDFAALGMTVSDRTAVKPGIFKIFGTHGQAYSITLPRAATFAGHDSVRVVTFVHDAGATPTLDDNGEGLFNIGATLRVGARSSAGTYRGRVDVIISNH